MIRKYYRSPYVQKGHGIGSLFRGVANFFRPIAKNIVNTLNSPEVKKVLKTVGKESLGTGSDLLIDSLKGKDINTKLDNRIKLAKKRIVDSIENGINMRRRAKARKKYNRFDNAESGENSDASQQYTKTQKHVGEYQRLNNKRKQPRVFTNPKKRKLASRRSKRSLNKTVFD